MNQVHARDLRIGMQGYTDSGVTALFRVVGVRVEDDAVHVAWRNEDSGEIRTALYSPGVVLLMEPDTAKRVTFAGYECVVLTENVYGNGRRAIELIDAMNGQPVLTASVNVPEWPLEEDEVAIKTWSENAGILDVLVEAGVVREAHRSVRVSSYVTAAVCRFKED